MNSRIELSRRGFLRAGAALTAGGVAARLCGLPVLGTASAQGTPGDYKALVCVFMFGGNDGNNTIVPLDAAGYAQYAAVRPADSGINLAQASLLPIMPTGSSQPFGLHPALGPLQGLFQQGKMAVLANVGTLVAPTDRASYAAGQRPLSLYSHSDQQSQWQSGVSTAAAGTGWGGRIADAVAADNAATGFPVITSLDGAVLFTTGVASRPLSVPTSGSFALAGFNGGAVSNARLAALDAMLAMPAANDFVAAAAGIGSNALALSATVNPILANASSAATPFFSGQTASIAQQLLQVAKLIEARGATGARRQVFFVQLGSFDTHNDQLNRQQALFADLAPALKSFYDATMALGVASQVTTFTLSDFGRTLQPASGGGTDHAWGSHHFILGDAVRGGSLYGRFPQLTLGGPDDAESEGRFIPTTAVDQYGATLARWFGVPDAQLATVFPNLTRFPVADVGFMS